LIGKREREANDKNRCGKADMRRNNEMQRSNNLKITITPCFFFFSYLFKQIRSKIKRENERKRAAVRN